MASPRRRLRKLQRRQRDLNDSNTLRRTDKMNNIIIKPDEQFRTLNSAPVVEAVLELRCRVDMDWHETSVMAMLTSRLTDFPHCESMKRMKTEMRLGPDVGPVHTSEDLGWVGARFQSADEKQIVRYERDVFAFSQLSPYPGWDTFAQRAMDLFAVVAPAESAIEIARVGLRFINRIELIDGAQPENYLVSVPRAPEGVSLSIDGFLHQEKFGVPGYDYAIQMTRTLQPPAIERGTTAGLIIDIDVSTTKPWRGTFSNLRTRLLEMRWLKNKTFFGSLTPNAQSLLS